MTHTAYTDKRVNTSLGKIDMCSLVNVKASGKFNDTACFKLVCRLRHMRIKKVA